MHICFCCLFLCFFWLMLFCFLCPLSSLSAYGPLICEVLWSLGGMCPPLGMLWVSFCWLLGHIPNQRRSQTRFFGRPGYKSTWGLFGGKMCHQLFSYSVFPLPRWGFSLASWSWEPVVDFGAGRVTVMITAQYVETLLWDCPCLADPRPWFLSPLDQMCNVV